MDMTRCLKKNQNAPRPSEHCFTETGLPKRLWGELASSAVLLKNRILHSALGSDTPYYRMFGGNANLSFFASHKITSIVHEEGHREKLDLRAWEGMLVGYNNDSPT